MIANLGLLRSSSLLRLPTRDLVRFSNGGRGISNEQGRRVMKGQRSTPTVVTRSRSQRFGDDGFESGSNLEIPLSAFMLIIGASILSWTTRGHTLIQNEISYADFVDQLLSKNCVERLEVINRTFVRVILRDTTVAEGSSIDASLERSRVERLRLKLLKRLQASILVPPMPHPTSVCCFEVGDLTNLEILIQKTINTFTGELASIKIPPIYYKDETDYVQLARAYVPTLLFTAASFITIAHPTKNSGLGNGSQMQGFTSGQSAHEKILKFGKATPVLGKSVPKITFADVAGLEQAKKEVSEFVDFLKQPKKFLELGAEIPKGALLVGPPGTGKTLLARAMAGEAGVPFYSMSGSDFMEMFVGVGPSRVRDLFDRARKSAPAIVFIDEIDTIGRSRASAGAPGNGGSDERESTLNALLVELDGFTTKSGVVILGGTNRADVLDPALTRPGRFDRQIALAKPSVKERKQIFDIHLKPVKLSKTHDQNAVALRLAALTPGLSGAEIRGICNEAAIIAARRDGLSVSVEDLEQAVERLIGGLIHTGEVLSPGLRDNVALHEAGHAILGWFLEHADPVLKLSIVPRASGTLGYTQLLPDEMLLASREQILTKICVLLGGRASEHLFADTVTTGAADDLEKATNIARSYVAMLGFDDEVGLASYPIHSERARWQAVYSEATAHLIDQKVKQLLNEQWDRAVTLLQIKSEEVRRVADLLLQRECISFADLTELLGARKALLSDAVKAYVEAMPERSGLDCLRETGQ